MEVDVKSIQQLEPPRIDLGLIFADLLRHIVPILLCAVIGGVLFGWLTWRDATEEKPLTSSQELEQEAYYQQRQSLQTQIAAAQEQITRLEAQKEQSLFLSSDLESFHEFSAIWLVDTHYQNMSYEIQLDAARLQKYSEPDTRGIIMSAYATLMTSGDFYSYVLEQMTDDVDSQTLGELLEVRADGSGTMLQMTALGNSEQMAQEIYSAAKAYLQSNSARVKASAGEHDLMLVKEWDSGVAGEQASRIIETQDAYNSQIAELRAAMSEAQTSLLTLKVPQSVKDAAAVAQVKAENANIMKSTVMVESVKSGIVAFVIALALACGVAVLRYFDRDAALDENEIQRRYGLTVLASVRRFAGKSVRQRVLSRLCMDEKRVPTVEDAAALARINILSSLEATGHAGEELLLIGQSGGLDELARLIGHEKGVEVTVGGNIMLDATAVETMRSYENIVMVERKERISYRELAREAERLQLLKKNVVGLIAL